MADTAENEKKKSRRLLKWISANWSLYSFSLICFRCCRTTLLPEPISLALSLPGLFGLSLGTRELRLLALRPTRGFCSSESAEGRKRGQSFNRGGQDGRAEAARTA